MAVRIQGTSTNVAGGVKEVTVSDAGRLNTLAATQTGATVAALDSNAYNLNTGVIASLSTANSALFYYKHLEDEPIIFDSFVIGLNDAASSDIHTATIIRNPTTGTIVSGASAGAISQNRDFGSANTLSNSTFYKGADGNTFTDGSDYITLYAAENSRTFFNIDTVLRKGNSIGVKITPSLSSGTISCYVAAICHIASL